MAESCTTIEKSVAGKTLTKHDEGSGFKYSVTFLNNKVYSFEQTSDSESYLVGTSTAFEGSAFKGYTAKFDNGDYCDAISAPRSGSVEFIKDCAATELTVTSVSETSTCVYKMVVSGVCPCAPTLDELVEKVKAKQKAAAEAAKAEEAAKDTLEKTKTAAKAPDWETPSTVKFADGSSLPSIGRY